MVAFTRTRANQVYRACVNNGDAAELASVVETARAFPGVSVGVGVLSRTPHLVRRVWATRFPDLQWSIEHWGAATILSAVSPLP